VTELSLRIAGQLDEPIVLDLLMAMHSEAGMGSINPQKVTNAIRHCREMGCILVVEVNGLVSAIMGLRPDGFWWSDDVALFDQFTYVKPEARKTRAIFKLVQKAKEIAVEAGMPLLIANFGPVDTDIKSRLYRRFGRDIGTTIITGDTGTFLWR